MVREKYYLNTATGEVTESHTEAMNWYRSGSSVEIWVNGRRALIWVF